jgi:hypothetical protein
MICPLSFTKDQQGRSTKFSESLLIFGNSQVTHALRRIMELRGRALSLVMAPPVFSYRPLARRRGVPDRASPGAAFGAVRVPDRPRHRV